MRNVFECEIRNVLSLIWESGPEGSFGFSISDLLNPYGIFPLTCTLKKYRTNVPLKVLGIIRPFNKKILTMKKYAILSTLLLPFLVAGSAMGQVTNPGTVVQQSASNHANNDVNSGVNNSLNNVEGSLKGLFKKKKKMSHADSVKMTQAQAPAASTQTTSPNPVAASTPGASAIGTVPQTTLSSYQNYDFVPGNNILFEDEFTEDQSGEFPTHWNLSRGQAILNMVGNDKAFFLTDGNYVHVSPLMKNNSYLTNNFSVEYDSWGSDGYCGILAINEAAGGKNMTVCVKPGGVDYTAINNFSGALPADIGGNNFLNKWHHIAIAFKNNQMKVYVDKYRVLLVPNCDGIKPANLEIEGIGSQDKPIIFKNFKVADGVQFYMTGQKFTDAKLVTHGINFDVDKATITPTSMGTLNMVVKIMKDNPGLKFEVDGHTDNTGTDAHNMALSQQRADAVKAQLIAMGIDASLLTSKGFGDTKPIADNTTLEGKADNRRVEFVKQ
jgi:OOP family OmpA-OmpF porin